jgi:O-6-methylguanine DNA methyltransferase
LAGSTFRQRVLSIVRRIPPGRVATYGDVAELAGFPRAARAVGTVMRQCRDTSVPCHRVIGAGGGLGGYGSHLQVKRELLRAEGLEVGIGRVRRFADVHWQPRASPPRKRQKTKADWSKDRAATRHRGRPV